MGRRISAMVTLLIIGGALLGPLAQAAPPELGPPGGGAKEKAIVQGAKRMGPFKPTLFKGDLRDVPRGRVWQPGDAIKTIPKRNNHQGKPKPVRTPRNPVKDKADPLRASAQGRAASIRTLVEAEGHRGQSFNGVYPPDPVGDAGEKYYIQMVNSGEGTSYTIYDKKDMSLVAGPNTLDTLAAPGSICEGGYGDPVVLYDSLAKRWFLSEFSSSNNTLCIYVSATSDPVSGGWHAYQFTSSLSFPDYPKYGVWPDGYYLTTNEAAPGIYALERAAMLAGEPAAMQFFSVSSLSGFGFQALLPADLDGMIAPPAGAPAYIIRHRDDEVHDPASNDPDFDFLELFEVHIDWRDESLSTLEGPLSIPVANFDSDLCGLISFACFPQPGTSQTLDPIREVVMWRLQYRNFGDHQTLVGNYTVDVDGTDHGGIRWFELRNGGAGWLLHQEGTHAPDASDRWLGSIAMDGAGNIGLAYSVVNDTDLFPSIRYTGRDFADHLGALPQGELTIAAGQGPQGAANRWGDYSSLNIDPVDDCTFWYTNEYTTVNGLWETSISTFRFESCGEPAFAINGVAGIEQSVCIGDPLAPLEVELFGIAGYDQPVTFSLAGLPPGVKGGFIENPLAPPALAEATLATQADAVAGDYRFEVAASDTAIEKRIGASLSLFAAPPAAPPLLSPENGAIDQPVLAAFAWNGVAGAQRYRLEVAADEAFSDIRYSAETTALTHTVSHPLDHGTILHWRVIAINPCGESVASPTRLMVTRHHYCSSPALAIPDDDPQGAADTLLLDNDGIARDLTVTLRVAHSWVGDLDIALEHLDSGARVHLIRRDTGGYGCAGIDIDASFHDDAAQSVADICYSTPPAITGQLRPSDALSVFADRVLSGEWRLTLADHAPSDEGLLETWCLSPSYIPVTCDGDQVTLAGHLIRAGEELTCNVGDIEVRDLVVEGTLRIQKSGKATLLPTVRSVPPDGRIEIRQTGGR